MISWNKLSANRHDSVNDHRDDANNNNNGANKMHKYLGKKFKETDATDDGSRPNSAGGRWFLYS